MDQSSSATVLAFDFSLDQLDVALRAADGSWPIAHHAYENNWVGFEALKADVLAHLDQVGPEARLTAVGESTGLYWWHAFYHLAHDPDLADYQPQMILLNPMHVKYHRKALPERDKDDPSDAHLVEHYYRVNGARHFYCFNERYLPLRELTRAYSRVVHTLGAEKAFCLSRIYLWASEYQRQPPFSNLFGRTSQYVLSQYPDLTAVAEIPTEELAAVLNQIARGQLNSPTETVEQLRQAVGNSYPLAEALRPAVYSNLKLTLERIRFLETEKQRYKALIEAQLRGLPEANLALAERGLGPILVAGLLAEIQDTRRFISGQKYDRRRKCWRPRKYRDGQAAVARLAGLWWPKNSSGRFEGQDRHLAHERNPHLRYWLVQAAHSLKGHQTEYAAYYWKKYQEANKHPHKRAIILTARKAVRMIFALLHKGQTRQLEEEAAT